MFLEAGRVFGGPRNVIVTRSCFQAAGASPDFFEEESGSTSGLSEIHREPLSMAELLAGEPSHFFA